jgi:GTP-binding protein
MRVLEARFVTSAPNTKALPPPTLPEVAFVGRSNVGKSSLIATLLDRKKLVRVSRHPGRTRALNFFEVRTDEGPLMLVDLPGYGYAKGPAEELRSWGPLITSYLQDRATLCLVVALFDTRRKFDEEDHMLTEMLAEFNRPAMAVATKIDKISKAKRKPAIKGLSDQLGWPVLGASAKTKTGAEEIWRVVGKACGIV